MEYNIYGQETRSRRCPGFIHVIKKGDTLYKLGKKYNVKVSAIIFANPYVNVYNLQIGDEICIPKMPSQRPPQSPPQSPGRVVPIPFYQGNEEDETNIENETGTEDETNIENEIGTEDETIVEEVKNEINDKNEKSDTVD